MLTKRVYRAEVRGRGGRERGWGVCGMEGVFFGEFERLTRYMSDWKKIVNGNRDEEKVLEN